MATNYPNSLDNFTNPTSASPINSPSHADQHSNANDAIEALESKVGSNNSVVTTSHDYKIAQLESLVTSAVSGAKSIYQDVRNQSGSNFVKATPVYISGSEGSSGKMLISAASNASEATSSKTMGLTTSAISNNSNGQVISEGILDGIDTTGAVDGDPVWLGVNGAKIYGYGSIPLAPAHLVFLGIVIRGGQANTGSMYVKIQNGFELQELHNVEISSLLNGNILSYDSATSTWKNTNTLQSTSSTVPLVIKGSTSQTANLQEWQDNTGAVKALVGSGGNAVFNGIRSGSGSTTAAINAYTTAAQIGILVRGAASQAANLQEWQDSTGAVNASLTSNGEFRISSIFAITSYNNAQLNMLSTGPRFTTNVAANVTLTVKGAASQTADLTQWQDSAGTVLTRINSAGNVYTSGYLTAGVQSPTGTLTVVSKGASVPVAVIKGAASQTANLQEWQNSAGTILAYIDKDGQILTPRVNLPANGLIVEGGTGPYIQMGSSATYLYTRSASNKGLVIQGSISQTANLQEWQDSAGTVLSKIDATGNAQFAGFNVQNSATINGTIYTQAIGSTSDYAGNAISINSGKAVVMTPAAASVGLVIKGAASQTANLQEWQNNSGTTLARVNQFGDFYITGGRIFRGNQDLGANLNILNESDLKGIVVKAVSGQTKNLTELQSSTGAVLSGINPIGQLFIRSTTPITASAVSQAITSVSFTSTTATYTFSATEQTISIGEYVTVFGITPSGYNGTYQVTSVATVSAGSSYSFTVANTTNDTVTVGTGYFFPSASVSISTQNKAHTGLIIKAVLGQTSSVMEIQNSLGQPTTWWDSTGGMTASQAVVSTLYSGGFMNTGTLGYFNATTFSPSVRPIVVRGAASQTADLQQWQDSAGTALAGIGPNGTIYAQGKTGNTDDLLYLRRADNNIYMYVDKDATLRGNFSIRLNQEPTIDTQAYMWSGTASRSALGVSGTGSTNPTFYAKATASQTSNLTEWQDSSGTALSYIKSDGSLNFIANSNAVLISGTSTSGLNRIISNGNDFSFSPYFDGLFAPANSAGRWRPSNDATSDLGSSGQRWKDLYATSGILTNNSISKVGLIVKAIASQTANLQEWQNSSGIVLASISAFGRLNSTYKASFSNSNFTITPVVEIISTGTGANSQGLIVKGASGQTANLQEWQDSSGAVLSKIDKDGNITAADLTLSGNLTVNGTTTNLNSVNLVIEDKNIIIADVATPTDTTADGAGITIKGATDKTFNWVQSTGRFTSSEPIQSSAFVSTYVYASQVGSTVIGSATLNTNSDTGGLLINTAGAANKGLTIRGAASQTANLQQWQDSNGSVLSRVQADGTFVWGSASSALQNSSGRLIVNLGSATSVGVTVKGFTSQTANLQEWQNSDAVSVAQISATGTVTIRPVGFSGNLNTAIISVTDRASTWTPGNFAFRSDSNGTPRFSFTAPNAPSEALTINGNYVGVQTPSPTSVFQVTSNGAGNTVSIIKGAVSQTANLQEWQNSAGYAGTAIDSGGSFYAPGIYSSYLMQATAGGAAVVPLTVKGVTSQTANLTEWKDSAGNAQAYVRYDGFINTNSSIRIAGDNLSVYRFQGVSDGNYTMNFPGSGNIQLFSATDSLGGGSKVLGISNATTVPSSNPTGGGILYVSSGSLVYRGAGGAITTIARSGNESSTISANTATTVDTVALSSFTTIEYTISIKQGSKVRSSKVLVHTDGTSIDSTEYGIMEMGGGITGILVTASVSSTNSILQVTITDASTTNATVKIIKTML